MPRSACALQHPQQDTVHSAALPGGPLNDIKRHSQASSSDGSRRRRPLALRSRSNSPRRLARDVFSKLTPSPTNLCWPRERRACWTSPYSIDNSQEPEEHFSPRKPQEDQVASRLTSILVCYVFGMDYNEEHESESSFHCSRQLRYTTVSRAATGIRAGCPSAVRLLQHLE